MNCLSDRFSVCDPRLTGFTVHPEFTLEPIHHDFQMQFPHAGNHHLACFRINSVASEGFDFIWAHIWESQTARDKCWNNWGENYKADYDKSIEGIMSYDLDNVYMFKPTVGKQPKMQNNSGSFVNTFYFCTFNDGYSMSDLDSYKAALNNTDGFSDYWWYVTLEPTFEPADPKPDFVWLDIWASSEDEASDRENWSQTDLPKVVEDKFSCLPDANGAGFIGTVIRS